MSKTMSDSFLLDALAKELQCAICRELLEDPRSPCSWGHSFCKKCLIDVIKQDIKDGRPLLCPLCRAPFGPAVIDKPIVVDKDSKERISKILEKLRLRTVKIPKRDVGMQTEPMATQSSGQQTHAVVVRDEGQQTNPPNPRVADQQQQRWVRLTMYPVESEGARVDRKLRKHELFLLDIPLKELPSFFFEVAMMLLK